MCNFAIQINCKIMNTKFNQFVIRHSQYFIYLIVFLLIFLNGVKRNPSVALTIAVVDTLFFVMAYQLFCLVFMHPPKWLQRGLVKIIVIILMIFVMSHLLFGIEYYAACRRFYAVYQSDALYEWTFAEYWSVVRGHLQIFQFVVVAGRGIEAGT